MTSVAAAVTAAAASQVPGRTARGFMLVVVVSVVAMVAVIPVRQFGQELMHSTVQSGGVHIFPEVSRRNCPRPALRLEVLQKYSCAAKRNNGIEGLAMANLRTCRMTRCVSILVTIAFISGTGCSRSRATQRAARGRVPLPPPVVQFEDDPSSEEQLQLNSTPMPNSGASYGPVPRISAAPLGSTGSSIDMRYPQSRGSRIRAVPTVPRGQIGAGPRLVSPIQPSSDETPVTLPNAADRTTPLPEKPADRTTPSAASDAPQYTMTTEPNVATGGPVTLEAIRSLQEAGFNTVLDLSPESEADMAEPTEVRRAGMTYIALPVTPKTLTRDTVDEFNRVIAESKRPIYIHDTTGARTGAMWYLNRLLVAQLPDDAARRQAAKAGLKDPGADDLTTDLWLAINAVRAENK